MENTQRRMARNLIVVGYSVIFAGTVTVDAWEISMGYFQQTWRDDVVRSSLVFAYFAAIIAWWFLSRVVANTPPQISLIRKAYFALALQALLLSCSFVFFLIDFPALSWSSASTWTYALGTISTAIGFFLMAASYPSSSNASDDAVVAGQ